MTVATTDLDQAFADIRQAAGNIEEDENALTDAVRRAYSEGASFTEIGEALGVTRQSAWERWHKKVK